MSVKLSQKSMHGLTVTEYTPIHELHGPLIFVPGYEFSNPSLAQLKAAEAQPTYKRQDKAYRKAQFLGPAYRNLAQRTNRKVIALSHHRKTSKGILPWAVPYLDSESIERLTAAVNDLHTTSDTTIMAHSIGCALIQPYLKQESKGPIKYDAIFLTPAFGLDECLDQMARVTPLFKKVPNGGKKLRRMYDQVNSFAKRFPKLGNTAFNIGALPIYEGRGFSNGYWHSYKNIDFFLEHVAADLETLKEVKPHIVLAENDGNANPNHAHQIAKEANTSIETIPGNHASCSVRKELSDVVNGRNSTTKGNSKIFTISKRKTS